MLINVIIYCVIYVIYNVMLFMLINLLFIKYKVFLLNFMNTLELNT